MNMNMKKLPLAVVIASVVSLPVWANGSVSSDSGVTLTKDVSVSKDLEYKGKVKIEGEIKANGLAMAVVENKQESAANVGLNEYHSNTAGISESSFENASGNIGVNVAAGDNNVQANSAALAEIDTEFAFGSGDAEIFSEQKGTFNETLNKGSPNFASLSGNSFKGATGNIGVNVAAGNNNVQANNMVASVANGRLGEASVSNLQQSGHNGTLNQSVVENRVENRVEKVEVGLSLNAEGTYKGSSEMTSQYYPEIWIDADGKHNTGDEKLFGHIDFDQSNGSGDKTMTFDEMGDLALEGTITGELPLFIETVKANTSNAASISGNAFSGASGNIGVNMASGTGNLQANNLAITTINSAGVIISE
ncbi:MAG: hypothetical protein ACRCWP_01970 [Shewanella sp.]